MSDNTFTLRIELGSDAMQSREDVALALYNAANVLHRPDDNGKIMDENGNTVGSWSFFTELEIPATSG